LRWYIEPVAPDSRLAPKYRNETNYGTAVYKANMTLGLVAMRVDGDKMAAAK
jgi:hypothetical protein